MTKKHSSPHYFNILLISQSIRFITIHKMHHNNTAFGSVSAK